MVANALSQRAARSSIIDVCLRMVVTLPFLDLFKEDQVEGLKKEKWKVEQIRGLIPLFIRDNQGLLTQCGRVWVPTLGGVRQTVLEEAHKSNFLFIQAPQRCTGI